MYIQLLLYYLPSFLLPCSIAEIQVSCIRCYLTLGTDLSSHDERGRENGNGLNAACSE